MNFPIILRLWKSLRSVVYTKIYCFSAGVSILMFSFNGLAPYIFRQKVEKTRTEREEMDGKVLIPAKVGLFASLII